MAGPSLDGNVREGLAAVFIAQPDRLRQLICRRSLHIRETKKPGGCPPGFPSDTKAALERTLEANDTANRAVVAGHAGIALQGG
jgi:hypothetical protein